MHKSNYLLLFIEVNPEGFNRQESKVWKKKLWSGWFCSSAPQFSGVQNYRKL